MAGFAEILVHRFPRLVQKAFGLKGSHVVKDISTEIVPSWPMFNGVETRFLEGWYRYGGSALVAAVAANNSFAQLRNPVGSGVIAVLEFMYAITGSAANVTGLLDIQYGQPGAVTDGAATLLNRALDGRNKGVSSLIATVGNHNAEQIGNSIFFNSTPANAGGTPGMVQVFPTYDNQEIVLSPGDAIRIQDTTQNEAARFTIHWRERAIEDSETK